MIYEGYLNGFVKDTAIDNNRKILIAGQSFYNSSYISTVLRYNANGTKYKSFGDLSAKIISFGSGHDFSSKIAALDNGNILVARHTWVSIIPFLQYDILIFRL
ncbi:NHL repeat-containing protein [Vaginella massiliensis]|uniref:hypothetical protein n=1 Tax=Vaginella massiliensis TaxID=1816680 RepID=UPI000837EE9E|nr:hypothetical protein [Vaginella massiliensis]